ncbi:putative regulatory protein, FmdB family [Malonomonas rubra DSM 5091]|uniref:Putative regulatory protein, FmdB family n=1 Tax=Malonomonas rubra DSM 5091 TaxID=1122189 RepID=A0A1M6DHA7_MALRU|nr:putative regulatory protein, FmdB family [Malonomonas rubra DSM 5091]
MPIFEYRCTKCEKITEKICSSTVTEIECPECHSPAKKTVSIFSGQTDSASAGGCMPSSGFS